MPRTRVKPKSEDTRGHLFRDLQTKGSHSAVDSSSKSKNSDAISTYPMYGLGRYMCL